MLGEEELQISKKIKKSAGEIGEPIISTFQPDYMVSKLKEIGFDQIDKIDRDKVKDYNKKYFFKRTDGLLSAFEKGGQSLIKAKVQRK